MRLFVLACLLAAFASALPAAADAASAGDIAATRAYLQAWGLPALD